MQIAQITINTLLIYLDIFEFRNYGILKNIHYHIESLLFDSVQKTESYAVYIRYKSYQFESIIYVPFSWYHFACAHCIVLM
jgi:hypothetical protein